MEIKNDTELNLYEVKCLENDSTIQILAISFDDLQKDLISAATEPSEIKLLGEVYLSNGIIKQLG